MTSPGEAAGLRAPARGAALATLALAALGVVYGDIGTSPLYALKECFLPKHNLPPTPENVLGILSLIFWSLSFVVSFKYIVVLLRVDNRGEGGILALLALVRPAGDPRGARRALVLLGLFGAALLYGDGVITPAVSVLGALEGISVATPALQRFIVPVAAAILVGLFLFQKRGTAGVGQVFGPIMIVWFIAIAVFGVRGILREPTVLSAINPWHAVRFFVDDRLAGFLILGSVVLVFTGGEALYADMGHFGRRPIRLAWFGMALPALLLNYFGQGALLLADPSGIDNPFYRLVPTPLLYPMVVVSTVAAVVASQALISGAFSLTRQAVQLGYSPRVTVVHTSRHEAGQIYIPEVNTGLMLACLALVLGFRSSTNLAGAYGIAVTGTMSITTVLFAHVARTRLRWPVWLVALLTTLFLVVDLSFFGANLVKIPAGGWFPLALAVVIFALMTTWRQGRVILTTTMRENSLPLSLFIQDLARRAPARVPGTAVFMTSDASVAPPVLLHHLKHNKVLHERVILMSVVAREIPVVPESERIELRPAGEGFYTLVASYGFMESPNVPAVLAALQPLGLDVKVMETTFYLGRETLIPTPASPARRAAMLAKGLWMSLWRKKLFVLMTNNARSATAFFRLPANRVVELGAQVQI
jgi:KUP system potassium uptake protein